MHAPRAPRLALPLATRSRVITAARGVALALVTALAAGVAGAAVPVAAAEPMLPQTTREAAPFVAYADILWYLQSETRISCRALAMDAALAQARLADMKPAVFARPTRYPALYADVLVTLRADWTGLEATLAWAARMGAQCPSTQLARIGKSASPKALAQLRRDAVLVELLAAYPTGDRAKIKADAKAAGEWRRALVEDEPGARLGARSPDLVRKPSWWLRPLSAAIAVGAWNQATWDAQIVAWNRALNAGDRDAAADLPRPW